MKILLPLLALVSAPLAAQTAAPPPDFFSFTRIPAPAQPNAIPLYDKPLGGPDNEVWDVMKGNGQPVVRNVTHPTLTSFLPDPARATGAAVIVAPGGGFQMLSMDTEGWRVAKWLADHGIAAFVLKYRLNRTAADEKGFMAQMGAVFEAAMREGAHPPDVKEPNATEDALAALRLVRGQAGKWHVDPARVGMIGFSAGAMTALNAALAPADRPAFFGYIYGPMAAIEVPKGAPPMFAALALDDRLFGRQGFGIIESWRKAGVPVELHAYEAGDHGFGTGKPGTTSTMMLDEFQAWLQARGLLSPVAPRTAK